MVGMRNHILSYAPGRTGSLQSELILFLHGLLMTAQKAGPSPSTCSLSARQMGMFVSGSPSYLHWPLATSTPHVPVKSEPGQ